MNAFAVFGFLVILTTVEALQILQPLPQNRVLLAGEPTTVSCIVGDASSYPNVTFKRRNNFFDIVDVPESPRIQINSSTRNDTTTGLLITTSVLHIKNVIPEDDQSKGQWMCYYHVPGVKPSDSGFSINLVPKSDLPTGVIKTTRHGDTVNLTCSITDGKQYVAPLTRVAWAKDMVILTNGSSPTTLEPLVINTFSSRDVGEYSCFGFVHMLMSVNRRFVLDKTTLDIMLKIDNGTTKVTGAESSNVTMDCPAEGYPLNVTWWKEDREGQQVQLENNQRYVISRPCSSCRYRLIIKNVQPRDQGRYICKATGSKQMGKHYFRLSFDSVACPQGMYGIDCSQMCLCKNNATCDATDGNCTCLEGFTGKYCEKMLATSPVPVDKKSSILVPVVVGVVVGIIVVIVIVVGLILYFKRKRASNNKRLNGKDEAKSKEPMYSEIPEDDNSKPSENVALTSK